MKIKFKISDNIQLYDIEAETLTLIKVSLIVKYGKETAFHIFQKKLDNNVLFYCPDDRCLQNLVGRNFNSYVDENHKEILSCINSIKEI